MAMLCHKCQSPYDGPLIETEDGCIVPCPPCREKARNAWLEREIAGQRAFNKRNWLRVGIEHGFLDEELAPTKDALEAAQMKYDVVIANIRFYVDALRNRAQFSVEKAGYEMSALPSAIAGEIEDLFLK